LEQIENRDMNVIGRLTARTDDNKVYHNAKTLLKIYSQSAWELSGRYADIIGTFDEYEINDIKSLEIIAAFSETGNTSKLTERLLSMGENKLIIEVINSAMLKLKEYPYKGELYYQIIYKNYFVKFRYTESEILESLCLSRSTYYRRRKEAVQLFGISLWQLTIPKVLNILKQ
jgi:hypothetical protein